MDTVCEERLLSDKAFLFYPDETGMPAVNDAEGLFSSRATACLCAAMVMLVASFCNTDTVSVFGTVPDRAVKSIQAHADQTVGQLLSVTADAVGGFPAPGAEEPAVRFRHGPDEGGTENTQCDAMLGIRKNDIRISFYGDSFADFDAELLKKYYARLVRQMFTAENSRLRDVELIGAQEKAQIEGFCGEKAAYDDYPSFDRAFEKTAAQNSAKIAVICKNSAVTYGELNGMANSIAYCLRKAGIGRGKIVAVISKKSIEAIAAILGIVKSGAAFLIIGADYPVERINLMLSDSGCQMLILSQGISADGIAPLPRLYLDDPSVFVKREQTCPAQNRPCDLLYVVYTSGTTGNPKGAMITHQNLLCMWKAWELSYKLKQFDLRLLQLSNMTFDVFVGDITRTLLSGGRMILCPEESRKNPAILYRLIAQHQINFLESTPLLLSAFADYLKSKKLTVDCLRILVAGADTCTVKNFNKIKSCFGTDTRVMNSYGITETTIDLSFFEGAPDPRTMQNTPIGKPMQNIQFHILDKLGRALPVMAYGELYVSGDCVGMGYLGKPDLTRERFLDINGRRGYKTGDVAKWLRDGNVMLRGRQDHQVKIRGYRIELNEIRMKLLAYTSVTDAVVTVVGRDQNSSSLCAYYIADEEIPVVSVRKYLEDRLPPYTVPDFFVQLKAFPTTGNGKVDMRALPEPVREARQAVSECEAIDAVDHRLRILISNKFGVCLTDDLNLSEQDMVSLGINSITLIELMVEVEGHFGIEFDDEFMDPDKFKGYEDLLGYVKSKVIYAGVG